MGLIVLGLVLSFGFVANLIGFEVEDGGGEGFAGGVLDNGDAVDGSGSPLPVKENLEVLFAPEGGGLVGGEVGFGEGLLAGGVGEDFFDVGEEFLWVVFLVWDIRGNVGPLDLFEKGVHGRAEFEGGVFLRRKALFGRAGGGAPRRSAAGGAWSGRELRLGGAGSSGFGLGILLGELRPPLWVAGRKFAFVDFLEGDSLQGGFFRLVPSHGIVEKLDEVLGGGFGRQGGGDEVISVARTGESDVEFAELFVTRFGFELGAVAEEHFVTFGNSFAGKVEDPLYLAGLAIALHAHGAAGGGEGAAAELGEDGHVVGEALGLVDGHHLHSALGIGLAEGVGLGVTEEAVDGELARLVEDAGREGKLVESLLGEGVF